MDDDDEHDGDERRSTVEEKVVDHETIMAMVLATIKK